MFSNSAFDSMFDIINESDSEEELIDNGDENVNDNIEEDPEYQAEMNAMAEEMMQLAPPVVDINAKPVMIEVVEFDPANNILDPDVREEFKHECVFEETDIFSRPISTTNTMEGYLSNVSFHERDLIEELVPDEDFVIYKCNYGKLKYEGYTEPVRQRKTNRGRKKKPKKKKHRKKQGNGGDFNSQVTVVIRSSLASAPVDGIVPYGTKVYKFKVFRTGKLQLPGVHQHLIDDVVACTKKIVQILNFHLHAGEENTAKLTNIININPVMKNYKFIVKLPPGHIIDMEALRRILFKTKTYDPSMVELLNGLLGSENVPIKDEFEGMPKHPSIFMLKYNRQDTKLSIKFSTPIYKKPKKKTRINIFMRGKINILGAFYSSVTHQICEFLHWVFERNYDTLIVPEGLADLLPPPVVWTSNIEDTDDIEFWDTINSFINWLPQLPVITDTEYNEMVDFLMQCYREETAAAEAALLDYFRGTDVGEYLNVCA